MSLELLASRNQYESPLIMRAAACAKSNVGDPDARTHARVSPARRVLVPGNDVRRHRTPPPLTVQLAAKYSLHTIEAERTGKARSGVGAERSRRAQRVRVTACTRHGTGTALLRIE